jgi:hypothetical protein
VEYTTENGRTFLSGKPKKTNPKLKDGKHDPIWYYSVTIWDVVKDGEPVGKPKCGTDPGVCIRGGGGGACESYVAAP